MAPDIDKEHKGRQAYINLDNDIALRKGNLVGLASVVVVKRHSCWLAGKHLVNMVGCCRVSLLNVVLFLMVNWCSSSRLLVCMLNDLDVVGYEKIENDLS